MIASESLIAFFGVACVAGFIDSIAGGGGLISLPALLTCGLSPAQALATNKGQSVFGSCVATLTYWRRGELDIAQWARAAGFSLAGAVCGASLVHVLDAELLRLFMPWLLLAMIAYVGVSSRKRSAPTKESRARLGPWVFAGLVGGGLGFYDGFFGPGVGSMLVVAHVMLAGKDWMRAAAQSRGLNFVSNFGSLLVFSLGGDLVWEIAAVMACGQILGARLGSLMVIKRGASIVRPLLLISSIAMTIRLLWQTPEHPLHRIVKLAIEIVLNAASGR
jgi:uncharacterized membrane protein YfcA